APNLFKSNYEFPIGLAMCAALLAIMIPRPARDARFWRPVLGVLLLSYAVYLGMGVWRTFDGFRLVDRNFYGKLSVLQSGDQGEEDAYRALYHGQIDHGEQMLNEESRRKPITYFCPDSGIGH